MHRGSWICLLIGILRCANGQGDSLRSALNAIDRRQRDLSDYDENEYGYTLNRPEDLTYLKAYGSETGYDKFSPVNRPPENFLDEENYEPENYNKRISSAFRERLEEDNQRQLEQRAQNLISNLDRDGRYNDEEYEELLRELWDKYRRPYKRSRMYSAKVDKRMYYPRMDSIGLRKRNRYNGDEVDDSYTPQQIYRDDEIDDENDDDEDYSTNYLRKRYYRRENKVNRRYDFPYSKLKRFPVSKRSSDYLTESRDLTHESKRSTTKKQTDPKVEKELSNIFGVKQTEVTTTKPIDTKITVAKKETSKDKLNKTAESDKTSKPANNKEIFAPVALVNQKPLQLKKKSIDWSDYFGLDRRKKSQPGLDKNWLMERYHKSIATSAKKRNAELPLSSFRNHDGLIKKETKDAHNDMNSTEDKKLDDIDSKLQVMEDKIVDDTLKYTGANEGETDPKEIQEVKDKIIARLAAAYNLEKMRNALGEYRIAVAKEREKLKNRKTDDDEYMFSEKKRTVIPRKQVVDEDRDIQDSDNNIKCTEGDEDCHEQNYRTPTEVIENHFGTEECPAIERACNDVASIVGQYGHLFRSACSMHQMCLLCSNNSWFSPTRQCNTLYLAKAFDLCKGNISCQKEAQRSIRYLLDVNHSVNAQPSDINDCELNCPETDSSFDLSSR